MSQQTLTHRTWKHSRRASGSISKLVLCKHQWNKVWRQSFSLPMSKKKPTSSVIRCVLFNTCALLGQPASFPRKQEHLILFQHGNRGLALISCYQKALVAEAAFSDATGTIMAELRLKLVCGSLSAARKHCLLLQFVFFRSWHLKRSQFLQ